MSGALAIATALAVLKAWEYVLGVAAIFVGALGYRLVRDHRRFRAAERALFAQRSFPQYRLVSRDARYLPRDWFDPHSNDCPACSGRGGDHEGVHRL